MPKDRKDPRFWQSAVEDARNKTARKRKEFRRFSSWFAAEQRRAGIQHAPSDANMTHLVVRTSVAEMFHHNPRFLVEPPSDQFGPSVFTPDLAKVETRLLNDQLEDVDLFRQGRRVLTDLSLGWQAVMLLGFSADVGVDPEEKDVQRREAEAESIQILLGRRPRRRDTDDDATHLDVHQAAQDRVDQGDVDSDEGSIAFHKKHMERHRKGGKIRLSETVRNEQVFCLRINPLDFFEDPGADDPRDSEWVGRKFLRPLAEAQNDPRYKREAAKKLVSHRPHHEALRSEDPGTTAEMALIFEIVDLRSGRVRTYGDTASAMLVDKPYKHASILPSGPYIRASFCEDPETGLGISPPKVYEKAQDTLSDLDGIIMEAARRSLPMLAASADAVDEELAKQIEKGDVGAILQIKNLGAMGDIRKIITQFPALAISETLFLGRQQAEQTIERMSGKGQARLAGGDRTKTATASAIVSESTSTLSDDNAAVWENFMMRVGRALLRLIRRHYSDTRVGELIGQRAQTVWPKVKTFDDPRPNGFTDRDILFDKNVRIVPGSAQRQNIAVKQKMVTEAMRAITTNPVLVQAISQSAPHIFVELLRRWFDTLDLPGIDFEALAQALPDAARAAQQAEATPGSSGGSNGSAGATPGLAGDLLGGLANAGGGRIPTGASQGDNPRPIR